MIKTRRFIARRNGNLLGLKNSEYSKTALSTARRPFFLPGCLMAGLGPVTPPFTVAACYIAARIPGATAPPGALDYKKHFIIFANGKMRAK